MPRGGARPGAGRPKQEPKPPKPRVVREKKPAPPKRPVGGARPGSGRKVKSDPDGFLNYSADANSDGKSDTAASAAIQKRPWPRPRPKTNKLRGPTRLYTPDHPKRAYEFTLLGATNEEIASAFGVNIERIYIWQNRHPAFAEALRRGKIVADAKVAASLYKRATGFKKTAVKLFYNAKQDSVTEHVHKQYYPPDTTAASLWLAVRRPNEWREKKHVVIEKPYGEMTQDERMRWALDLIARADGLLEAPLIEHESNDESNESNE